LSALYVTASHSSLEVAGMWSCC